MGIEGVAAVGVGPVGVMLIMRRNVTQTLEGDADVRRAAEELHVANDELADAELGSPGTSSRKRRPRCADPKPERPGRVRRGGADGDRRCARLGVRPRRPRGRPDGRPGAVAAPARSGRAPPHCCARRRPSSRSRCAARTSPRSPRCRRAWRRRTSTRAAIPSGSRPWRVALARTARLQRRGARGGRDRRAPARHRQDRDPGAHPPQAGPARRGRVGDHEEHPVISEYILSEVDLDPIVLQIARSSHERMDGDGYPDGLAGEDIPLPARIVLVADAFDALTSDRPYRRGRASAAALEELSAHAGTQFCPGVVGGDGTALRGGARGARRGGSCGCYAGVGARRPTRASASRTASRSASVASTSGRRKPPTSWPSRFSAVLIGIGLIATRSRSRAGSAPRGCAARPRRRLRDTAATISFMRSPAMWLRTQIPPVPPSSRNGKTGCRRPRTGRDPSRRRCGAPARGRRWPA